MGQYNQAVITSAGQGLLAGVIASGKSLAFTNAKTSTRIYSSGLEALTSIADVMQTDAVSSATVMSNSQVKISTRFTNEDITAAYDINTIGIFAKADGDASDTLFAVITAVTPDSMPKYTSSNPVAYIYDVTIGMSNAQNITLVVSPTGTPSYGDLAAAQTAAENASAANLAPAYDSTATYAKDDFCVNGGKLYQCNADISTAEAFNPAHWTEVKVTEVMGGGGGVTPEIMAQIENAQWKTESSEQLFTETVTTEQNNEVAIGRFDYSNLINTDTLIVTFNGIEYTCHPETREGSVGAFSYGAHLDEDSGSYSFDEFPFAIDSVPGVGNMIVTESPGTYTITASTETVTTTDTFKQAVNDIAGWKTEAEVNLFHESVTTSPGSSGPIRGRLEYGDIIDSDVLKVNFNGVEYTCPKVSFTDTVNGYGGIGSTGIDFTEFPFAITSEEDNGEIINTIVTETAGTYSVSASGEGVATTEEFNAIAGTFTANGYTNITDILDAIHNFRHVIFIKNLSDFSYRVYSLTRYQEKEGAIEGSIGQFAEFTSISYNTENVTLYKVVITKSGATESQANLRLATT